MKILNIGILSVLISFISCTEELSDINKDPNSFNDVSAETLFVGSLFTVLDAYGGNHNEMIVANSARTAGALGRNEMNTYGFNAGHINSYYTTAYYAIKSCQEIIDKFSDNTDYTNRVAMAKIWMATINSYVVGTWGPIAMSEAVTGEPNIRFDSEEEVYTGILTLLKDGVAAIDPAGDKFLNDPMFNGNIDRWVKFGNTMRLKIALRASEGWPSLASTHGQEVMAAEDMLINSNSDEANLQWGTTAEDWSHYHRESITHDEDPEVINRMNHLMVLFMKTYKDPRIAEYSEPSVDPYIITEDLADAKGSATTVSVTYAIEYVGAPVKNPPLPEWDLNATDNPFAGFSYGQYSMWNRANFYQPDVIWTIQSAADSKFCQAEAALKGWGGSKSAQTYYEEGIDLAFAKWGFASQSAAYKARDGIAWGTSSTGDRDFMNTTTSGITNDPLEKIVVQRWLNGFPWGFDAWCLQRRTRKLKFRVLYEAAPSTGERFADIQERVIYPLSESAFNTDAYNAAVASMGPDSQGRYQGDHPFTVLEFAKMPTWYDWATYRDAEYNYDFASQYYGDSVDDLEAAGKTLRTTPVTVDDPLKINEYIIN